MPIRQVTDEVLYADEPLVILRRSDIEDLKRRAESNPRKRVRICTHRDIDSVHEMFIVHAKEAYVRPHKHIGKPESLYVIEGHASVIVFGDDGAIQEILRLEERKDVGALYYRMNSAQYHSLLITSEFFVFHETTAGPFRRSDTVFAPWAPEETDVQGVHDFFQRVERAQTSWAVTGDPAKR